MKWIEVSIGQTALLFGQRTIRQVSELAVDHGGGVGHRDLAGPAGEREGVLVRCADPIAAHIYPTQGTIR